MFKRIPIKRILILSFLGLWLAPGPVAHAGEKSGEKKTGSFRGWFVAAKVCGESATFHDKANNQSYFITQQALAMTYENREVVIQGTLEDSYLTVDSVKPVDPGPEKPEKPDK